MRSVRQRRDLKQEYQSDVPSEFAPGFGRVCDNKSEKRTQANVNDDKQDNDAIYILEPVQRRGIPDQINEAQQGTHYDAAARQVSESE
jgi:hypothetical protein